MFRCHGFGNRRSFGHGLARFESNLDPVWLVPRAFKRKGRHDGRMGLAKRNPDHALMLNIHPNI
jgi:hypothetical protein